MHDPLAKQALTAPHDVAPHDHAMLRRRSRYAHLHFWLCRLAIVASIATLFAESNWIADLLANLRVQQTLGLVILLAWSVTLRRWPWSLGMALCLMLHLPWFRAVAPTGPPTIAADRRLTVTTANVLIGNPRLDDVEAAIMAPQADILAILELDSLLQTHLAARLQRDYPHRHELPRDEDGFGIGLYARVPLEDVQVVDLGDIFRAIAARVEVRGQRYRILTVHTMPPIGPDGFALRSDHLRRIAEVSREFQQREPDCPLVLMGDLNLTPWSPHFRTFVRDSGLQRASRGAFLTPTWHAFPGFPFGLAIDHVLTSSTLECSRLTIGPSMGSDHRALTAELQPAR